MRVRPQMTTRRKVLTLLAMGAITLTACGTRLPDKDFALSQNGQPVPGASQGTSTTPNGTGTTGPATGNGAAAGGGSTGTKGTAGHSATSGGAQGPGSQKVSGSAGAA